MTMAKKKNVPVYMDVCLVGIPFERMVFELFYGLAPFTAENFRVLCTGEKGISPKSIKPLCYKNHYFHVKKRASYVKGGVFCYKTGEGGESALGSRLPAESNNLKHDRGGLLSMPRGDGSYFVITLRADQRLDSSHVVIGKLVEGLGTLWQIKDHGFQDGIKIMDSGELYDAEDRPEYVIVRPCLSDAVDKGHLPQIKGSVSGSVIHNSSPRRASKDCARRQMKKKRKSRTDEGHLPKSIEEIRNGNGSLVLRLF